MDLKQKYREETSLEPYGAIEQKDNYTRHYVKWLEKQCAIHGVVKSLPTEQCVRDWWREGTGDEYFWKHETDWSNEEVFREIYQALQYFINRWQ